MWTIIQKMASKTVKRKSTENGAGGATKRFIPNWSMGLKASMEDPALKVEEDDKIVIIKDKYPKARYHFLVLPKENISNMKSLTKDHIPLLQHMHKKGQEVADRSSSVLKFRLGYHAIPSMSHIHLHVISQDFDSTCLKTKKHWNSFTTEYFIDSDEVMSMMEEDGKFLVNTSKYSDILKRNLKCHVCDKDFSTMPALKQHLLSHIPREAKSSS